MYSVVLMMALSGGAESTDFGKKCHGASGCTAPVAASCRSTCKAAHKPLFQKKPKCQGAAPACHGAKGGLFHKAKGCHGVASCAGAPACTGGPVGAPAKEMIPSGPAKEMPKTTTMVPAPEAGVNNYVVATPTTRGTRTVGLAAIFTRR